MLSLHRATDLAVVLLLLLAVLSAPEARQLPVGLDDALRTGLSIRDGVLFCGFVLLWQASFILAGLYDADTLFNGRVEAARVLAASSVAGFAAVLLIAPGVRGGWPVNVGLLAWAVAAAATLAFRWIFRLALTSATTADEPRVLIIGTGPRAARLYHELTSNPTRRHRVVGLVDVDTPSRSGEVESLMLGPLNRLEHILMTNAVDEVLIALPVRSCYEQIQTVILTCAHMGVRSRYLADVFQGSHVKPRLEPTAGHSMIALDVVRSSRHRLVKRSFDLVVSAIALLLLAPLLAAIALAVKLNSPGPILFSQERLGLNRRRFRMYKFRTMVQDAERLQPALEHLNESAGPVFKIRNDPRVTPLGRFLRRSSLDELPQLFNVLRGEMSLVGPRPLPLRDVQRFPEPGLMRRFSVRPGLTGLWQVSGRSDLHFDDWISLDLHYIDGWSLVMDFRILVRTFPAVFSGKGAT